MKSKYKKGEHLQFDATRVMIGNPVTGKFISEDKEWLTVELTKQIEGLVNVWEIGYNRSFRKSLISNIKKIK